jgi:hypothetical protein
MWMDERTDRQYEIMLVTRSFAARLKTEKTEQLHKV